MSVSGVSGGVIWIGDDEWTSYSALLCAEFLTLGNIFACGGNKVTKLSTRIDSVN